MMNSRPQHHHHRQSNRRNVDDGRGRRRQGENYAHDGRKRRGRSDNGEVREEEEEGNLEERQWLRSHTETDTETDRDDRWTRSRRPHRDSVATRTDWGDATTVVSGDYGGSSLRDARLAPSLENAVGFRYARYAGPAVATVLSVVAYASPIVMVVLPKLKIAGWDPKPCDVACEGALLGVAFKLLFLAAASWAVFLRRPTSTLPRIFVFRAVVVFLLFLVVFVFWLFYVMHVAQRKTERYDRIVAFADALVETLLFVHYVAVVLLELRHLQSHFVVRVVRSPDGESRSYAIGDLSVQRVAAFCLEQYVCDFDVYNPYLEFVARRRSARTTEFKVYDIDGVDVAEIVGTEAAITARNGHQMAAGHNDRFYEELDYERRVSRRRARLTVAVEEAFSHIKRVRNAPPGSTQTMTADEAANAIFPTLVKSLQKYLRITRQQPRYSVDNVMSHLSLCLAHDLSPKAFLDRYLTQGPVIWNDADATDTQSWMLVCDTLLNRTAHDGTVFQLCRGDVSLLVTVRRLPHFNLTEDGNARSKEAKFVLRLGSETAV